MNYDLPLGILYSTVVIDPPWKFGDSLPGPTRGASHNYETLTPQQIACLDIPHLATPNAHLWLWAPNSFLHEAFHLISWWGFEYKTTLTWVKVPGIGMGRYLRNTTEHCLFAVRGKLPRAPGPANVPSHVFASRRAHSEKPDEAYDVIRKISYEGRIDLFARKVRDGFDGWGDQYGVVSIP